MSKIVHPELSYAVQGMFMDIYNKHGPMLHEEIYENIVAYSMTQAGYPCQRQQEFHVLYKQVRVATFRTDVSLLPQLVIEIKVAPYIDPLHVAQTITYLKVSEADLGIVVNFGGPSLEFKRVPNFIRRRQPRSVVPFHPGDSKLLYAELTAEIRRCLYEVHGELGPGFWHRVYRDACKVEFELSGLSCEHRRWMDIYHDGWHAGRQRCNVLVVDDRVVVTPIAVGEVTEAMRGQLKAHLRRVGLKIGLLANFHAESLAIETIRVG
ncbi:MAG: GxxExxY protein [Anaerolineae bacterium]|nr:MAG: GxxExxY protein [Anaerolineae bacterium]